jgi:hypothetical protein
MTTAGNLQPTLSCRRNQLGGDLAAAFRDLECLETGLSPPSPGQREH